MASATVLLSPREKDGRGDKRGNFSAMGHVYFVTPLKHVKGQEKAFALRWRKMVLARREYKRIETKAVPQEKTHKATTTTTTTTPAKVTTPVVSEATA